MASVILDFIPQPGYTKLHIFEAPTEGAAPGGLIETVVIDPASPPTRYTTNLAGSSTDWFSIQWEDDKGGLSPLSDPVQGGTFTVVNDLINRVLLRDSSLDEQIVAQTAEWVVSRVLGVNDPYAVDPSTVTIDQMEGMTLLTLARSHIHTMVASASSSASYTAGLVSQKSEAGGSKNTRDLIEWLLGQANDLLGLRFNVVMLMPEIDPTGMGSTTSIEWDHSRLLLGVGIE